MTTPNLATTEGGPSKSDSEAKATAVPPTTNKATGVPSTTNKSDKSAAYWIDLANKLSGYDPTKLRPLTPSTPGSTPRMEVWEFGSPTVNVIDGSFKCIGMSYTYFLAREARIEERERKRKLRRL